MKTRLFWVLVTAAFVASSIGLVVWAAVSLPARRDAAALPQILIVSLVALAAAAMLFGAFQSMARVRGHALGAAFEVGGPAAFFVIVLAGGLYYIQQVADSAGRATFTTFVMLVDHATKQPVKANGRLVIHDPKMGPRSFAVADGTTTITLSSELSAQDLPFSLEVPDYKATGPPHLRVAGGNASVSVERVLPNSPAEQTPQRGPYAHQGALGVLYDFFQQHVPREEFVFALAPTNRQTLRKVWIDPEIRSTTERELMAKICDRLEPCLRCTPPANAITTRVLIEVPDVAKLVRDTMTGGYTCAE